jgi:DNA-binding transcriptional LysR family regulator
VPPLDASPFRVGFVTGATPDKWAGIWRQRTPRDPLELVPVEQPEQEAGLRAGDLDMALVRLPINRDGLHCIPLYDLADEQLVLPHESGWTPSAEQLAWPPMSVPDAVEAVAGGTGVLIVPMSVARLHQRKDATYRPVVDVPPTKVGLAWLMDNEDPRVQTFIGIVRGRTERSSRG